MIEAYRSKRIGVVLGGLSSERDVSLKTGAGVHAALLEEGAKIEIEGLAVLPEEASR